MTVDRASPPIPFSQQEQETKLLVSEFDYYLPQGLIAQYPLVERDESRLIVVDRQRKSIDHSNFRDIVDYINPGDCLVINDTKVLPARLIGKRVATGGKIEILLLKRLSESAPLWSVLAKPGRLARLNARFAFGEKDNALTGEIVEVQPDGIRTIRFECTGSFEQKLAQIGRVPLPPYIKRSSPDDQDFQRYQTVYGKVEGAIAAPTAGLHFTDHILDRIRNKGASVVPLTLHVGLGTFAPVKTERVEDHTMHEERYHVLEGAATIINRRKGKVFAVGTTVLRTLESTSHCDGTVHPGSGETDLFIYPGYEFKVTDNLLTNFHLPKTTLLMLVCAFGGATTPCGKDLIFKAYEEAIEERYRFYSYGDAMLIV